MATAFMRCIIIRFRDGAAIPYEDNVEEHLDHLSAGSWAELEVIAPGLHLSRALPTMTAEDIESLEQRATTGRPRQVRTTARSFFAIRFSSTLPIDPTQVLDVVRRWPAVEEAYLEGEPAPPPVTPDDPDFQNQGYLGAAATGLDAAYAWKFKGGDGSGVGLVDLEYGWTLNHEDLIGANITLISGLNFAYQDHGTAVLGEVCAVDNKIGGVGFVPNVLARVVGQTRQVVFGVPVYSVADAIYSAATTMKVGDVLLLEAQSDFPSGSEIYYPVEIYPLELIAIQNATAAGIVVVEAAGNGAQNLDNFSFTLGGPRVLNRNDPSFIDSFAIMVGAATSAAPHSPMWFTNHGSRVDCYGWGENVVTTGGDGKLRGADPQHAYTNSFSGTSSASPMIAGCAVSIQGAVKAAFGKHLDAYSMRELLATAELGTVSKNPKTDGIGVMPNLRKVFETTLFQLDGNWRSCSKCAVLFSGGSVCQNGGIHDDSVSGKYCVSQVALPGAQQNWCWCKKCGGMFFAGDLANQGACPKGGSHDKTSSGKYWINLNTAPPNSQSNWRWCSKCYALFFGNTSSLCPKGGIHDGASSGNYALVHNRPTAPGQHDWAWCKSCHVLFHRGGLTCAAGGAHNGQVSRSYCLAHDAPSTAVAQSNWRKCTKCRSVFHAGSGAGACPAGAAHDASGSPDYFLRSDVAPSFFEEGWQFCRKCNSLFSSWSSANVCPKGASHDGGGSGNYVLVYALL